MSLVVWLPLNGDLRNLGCSDITVTNNGATVNNTGKIGKCYYFNGASQYLQLSKSLGSIYSHDFSWSIWLKPTDNTRGIIFSEYSTAGSSGVAFELLANRVIRVYWNGSPDWNFNVAIERDKWSHVAITKSTNHIKVYINGVFVGEKIGTLSSRSSTACIRIGDDYRGGTSVSYMGYMNDARIYDHCLSAAEVHEIAQGLVLHYKLNDLTHGIYDSSGYGHNGEVINTITVATGSPRYDACVHFSATNQKIKIDNFPTSGFNDSYSFAWWAKVSSVTPMHWGFADGIRLNGMYTGRLWNTSDSSSNPLYIPGTTTQVTAPTVNTWHHWVMTSDGTSCKVYQDGQHWATAKTYKQISGTTIYLNGWDAKTNYSSNNLSISDFRIYCTALNANDVLALYSTSAKVDNKQNLHARELVEDSLKIQINARGQALCTSLNEDEATKFYKTDSLIETNEIIEF